MPERPTSIGLRKIIDERIHQLLKGYDVEHDPSEHSSGELFDAAVAVLLPHVPWMTGHDVNFVEQQPDWIQHYAHKYWPADRRQDALRVAGAFLAAELNRIHGDSGDTPPMQPPTELIREAFPKFEIQKVFDNGTVRVHNPGGGTFFINPDLSVQPSGGVIQVDHTADEITEKLRDAHQTSRTVDLAEEKIEEAQRSHEEVADVFANRAGEIDLSHSERKELIKDVLGEDDIYFELLIDDLDVSIKYGSGHYRVYSNLGVGLLSLNVDPNSATRIQARLRRKYFQRQDD